MKLFFGTKTVFAQPMRRGDYNTYRGWKLPQNENGDDAGMLVEYTDGGGANHPMHDGYISWSPSNVFERAYKPSGEMNFGHAIEALKQGLAVSRVGWNGKGMFLYLVPENAYLPTTNVGRAIAAKVSDEHQGHVPYGAYIAMKTAQGNVVPWLASQTDVLADDWCITPIE